VDNKNRIIEEASRLFRTYGIRSVTMDLLATNLGISKRTIYEVFKDKDELLTGVLQWMYSKQREKMTAILEESENVIVANFRMIEMMRDHFQNMSPAFQLDMKKYHHLVLSETKGKCDMDDYRNGMEIVERGIKEGVFRKDLKAELVNRCIFELIRISADNEIFPLDSYSRNDIIKNVYINYLKGISTEKGLEIINRLEKKMEFFI
jgi:TetR/AcrR family transcriptional regulator, cholesterol catabolism regulator